MPRSPAGARRVLCCLWKKASKILFGKFCTDEGRGRRRKSAQQNRALELNVAGTSVCGRARAADVLVAHAMAQASSSANTVVIDVAPAVPTGGKPDGPRAKAPAAELPAPARLPAPGATPSAAPPATAKSAAAPAAAPATEPAEKPCRPPPAPNKKSYLPSFIAPEAYGKKKAGEIDRRSSKRSSGSDREA